MPSFGCFADDDRRQNGGLAVGRDDGAVGLAGYLAGFEDELAAAPIEFHTMNVKHCRFLSWFSIGRESHEQDGETLGANDMRPATASGDPAMALQPFGARMIFSPAICPAASMLPDLTDSGRVRHPLKHARHVAAQNLLQRRMPSLSISVL